MGALTIPARCVARFLPRSVSGFRGIDRACQPESAAISGPAPIIETTPSGDGLALLQARRLVLLTEARRLRDQRRSKQASICEAELRDVTHRILAARRAEHFPAEVPR